jgi:hypothetical protein
MIKYALGCAEGHEFESWFPDSGAYETLRKRRLVTCPDCGSTEVGKAIMAPAVVGAERAVTDRPPETLVDDKRRDVRQMVARLRHEIEASTVDVGARFPEMARAMHQGDEPEQPIRGRASLAEAKALVEEGVQVLPMPALADEFN